MVKEAGGVQVVEQLLLVDLAVEDRRKRAVEEDGRLQLEHRQDREREEHGEEEPLRRAS